MDLMCSNPWTTRPNTLRGKSDQRHAFCSDIFSAKLSNRGDEGQVGEERRR
jgi:hypothetical protein